MNHWYAKVIVACASIVISGNEARAQSPEVRVAQAQPEDGIDELIKILSESDWGRVSRAAFALEANEARAIPALLKLLERDELVKLENTADLIYPGAAEFYGHGLILDYDVDWLSVRAGWVLEQLTFQDFGFSEKHLDHDELLRAVATGKKDVPLRAKIEVEQRKKQRAKSVLQATEWRKKNQDWKRLPELVASLDSGDRNRTSKALHWLRFGNSPIAGFSKEVYIRDVFPIVERLAKSGDEGVATQAGYLVQSGQRKDWRGIEQKLEVSHLFQTHPAALAQLIQPGEIHEFLRSQAAWKLCQRLEGYEALRDSFEITQAIVGHVNSFPESLHVSLKTTRRAPIDAIWWWNPVGSDGQPQRNWKDLLTVHEAATSVLSKHAWLAEWREAAANRSVELHAFDNHIGVRDAELKREILPIWQHASFAGEPTYRILARRGNRHDTGWAVIYFGKEERQALITSTTNPDWKPTHWLDGLDLRRSANYVVVQPDGKWQVQTMPGKP